MRDAQSALDQLISFQGKTITEQDVLSVFGLVSHVAIADLGMAVLKGDVPNIIECVGQFDQTGKDLQRLLFDLLDHFRNVLVYVYTQKADQLPDITGSQLDAIKAQAEMTEAGRVSRVLDILIQSESRLRHALSRRTLLEMALIRSARAAVHASIDEIIVELDQLKQGLPESEKKKS